ncbi:hypothetical protein; putative signal peptide [Frankia alni ACN14a]|uniref:Uncharacterized protein n=1 Tax=Frankia alni (strain DSM 45986 / CECT 9034 / ACN14a) TaxID=326424 RepID=Q0RB46_FRAAA|nr:hypothetical protein; putative signal peptide [Frankia alni ACN14a]
MTSNVLSGLSLVLSGLSLVPTAIPSCRTTARLSAG